MEAEAGAGPEMLKPTPSPPSLVAHMPELVYLSSIVFLAVLALELNFYAFFFFLGVRLYFENLCLCLIVAT